MSLERNIADALIRRDGVSAKEAIAELIQLPVREILLFGSRATGEERPTSDVDAVAFVDIKTIPKSLRAGVRCRTAGVDLDLDLDLQPSHSLNRINGRRLYWRDGLALYDPEGRLQNYLNRLQRRAKKGPAPISQAERDRWNDWLDRMFRRIRENLTLGNQELANYQLSWVHFELLSLYCSFRAIHSMGARSLLKHIESTDPEVWEILAALSRANEDQERVVALQNFHRALNAATLSR